MDNYLIYDDLQEVIQEAKSEMICDNCKFCYSWKNDGRWYRCENEDTKRVGVDQIPSPRTFGCINFEKIEENENQIH